MYEVKWTSKFKKSYKLAKKKLLIYLIENDVLTLTLVDKGTHSDLFDM